MTPAPDRSAESAKHFTLRAPLFVTAAVMIAFAASRLAIVGVPSEREYDEGVYLLSARAVLSGHELFTAVFSSQPPAFLETLALAMRLAGDSMETGRLLILAFALATLAAIADLARRIAGPWAAPAAAAGLALSMTFGDLAHVVQAESPAVAAALVSLCAGLEARRRGWHRGWLFASGALLALGALFKLMVVPMAAPLGLLLLLAAARDDETRWEIDGRGLALLGAVARRSAFVAAGALAVGLLPLLVYDHAALYQQTVAFHVAKHEAYLLTQKLNLIRTARHVQADAAIVATAAAGILLLLWRKHVAGLWLLVWLAAMVAVIAVQTPLFWRHFVLISPPVVLAAAVAVPMAAQLFRAAWLPAFALATISLWTLATVLDSGKGSGMFPLLPQYSRRDTSTVPLEAAARWLRRQTTEDDLVAGDDPIVIYLSGRQAPPALCDTSSARIKSKSLTIEEATRESARARVILLVQRGRLSRLHGYLTWLSREYERQPPASTGLGLRRSVWIRKTGVATPP